MSDDRERLIREQLSIRELVAPAEAAFLIKKSTRTIYDWIGKGLPHHVDPRDGQMYVTMDDVHEYMRAHPTRRRKGA